MGADWDRRRSGVAHTAEAQELSADARPVHDRMIVGAAEDRHEVEADRLADSVTRAIATRVSNPRSTRIRRSATGSVVGVAGGPVDEGVEARVHASRGSSLHPTIRREFEGAFGVDFGGVRVHRESVLAPELGAEAFTHGSDIHFAPDRFVPETESGSRLIAHELAHVVQNGAGVRRSTDRVIRRS
jgi:hypothetical protein